MLTYIKNDSLVTTTLANPYDNAQITGIISETASLKMNPSGRFYKIISSNYIPKEFGSLRRSERAKKIIKEFREIIHTSNGTEYIDWDRKIGYAMFPGASEPVMCIYSILLPELMRFMRMWVDNRHMPSPYLSYDLSRLFGGMDNYYDVHTLFLSAEGKEKLYQYFPEFAMFFYELYPYMDIKDGQSYDIGELTDTKDKLAKLGLSTLQCDQLIRCLPAAANNSQVLKMIRSKKTQ